MAGRELTKYAKKAGVSFLAAFDFNTMITLEFGFRVGVNPSEVPEDVQFDWMRTDFEDSSKGQTVRAFFFTFMSQALQKTRKVYDDL